MNAMSRQRIFTDEPDESPVFLLAKALEQLGVKRPEACLVAVLSVGETLTTAEIAKRTDLRQPEISTATRSLRDRGWLEESTIPKKKGKGRPMHSYRLSAPLRTIRRHYEAMGETRIEPIKQALGFMKECLAKPSPI